VSYNKIQFIVWGLLAAVIGFVFTGYIRKELLTKSNLPVLSDIRDFDLTNQLGEKVTLNDLLGKVWVADIIFSRCGGPCPKMTERMEGVQSTFDPTDNLKLVTLTTDPDYDKPKVLKTYSERFKADPQRWLFLTGTKSQIRDLAIGGMKLTALEKPVQERESSVDLFIHSTIFVLIDKHGRMRAVYESLEPDFKDRITRDVRSLLREKA
jgi:protein SCO1/2